ncbi:MAG TPA: hypothetical protein VG943_04855 [Caulobacterales bacterium]|nr:hypothetical protein [Caulobacterales bacterium]
MAAALSSLFDKRKMALTKARLRAWWEGEDFDEVAAEAEIEAELAAANTNAEPEDLFDEPEIEPPPRVVALSRIWGEGRIRPGDDTADALEPARLGLAPDGVLALLSPGLIGPVAAIAGAHPGKIDVYEWREETIEVLRAQKRKAKLADRVTVTLVDLEAHVWPANTYDGLYSVDDFAYAGYPPHLAVQVFKCLKPGACAVVEAYVGLPLPELATAFASSFAEPQIKPQGDLLQFFTDARLTLEADEDLTEEMLDRARQGFKRLEGALKDVATMDPATARELIWEAEAWRMRMKLMTHRRLERRRFILRKPTEEAPAPAAG